MYADMSFGVVSQVVRWMTFLMVGGDPPMGRD